MRSSRLFWNLYLGYVVLILVTTTAVGVLVGRRMQTQLLDDSRRTLHNHALVLRELLPADPLGERLPSPGFQEEIRRLGGLTNIRFTYIRDDGRVLADSDEAPERMDDHSRRPEVVAAARDGVGISTRFSTTLETRMMYLALSVRDEGGALTGYVRAALPLRTIDQRLTALRNAVALAAGIAALVALAIGLVAVRRFTAPLVKMSDTARSIAAGHYDRRLASPQKDEMGAFAHAFNLMAGQLQERIETITDDRNRLLAILAGMAEGVVAVDREGRVLHMNAVAGRILGADPADASGRHLGTVTRVREIEEALTETMVSGVERSREIVLPVQERVLAMHSAPIGADDVSGAVVVLHDVTELRRLEAIRRDFVANVSHELKTPLTVVRGIVETLLDDSEMPRETRRRFLGKVSDQSTRLAAIVADLLTLARAESSPEVFERVPLDLRWLAEESHRALAPSAESKGVALELDLAPDPVPVVGDRAALRLVIDNLLDNAVKYTSAGGHVSVGVWTDEDHVHLVVTDTGIGIEEHERERIFERFYRVDKARSRELGGTGLGLSIVKHMVQVHDGDVSVTSAPGAGSSFRVRLPLDRSLTRIEPVSPADADAGPAGTI